MQATTRSVTVKPRAPRCKRRPRAWPAAALHSSWPPSQNDEQNVERRTEVARSTPSQSPLRASPCGTSVHAAAAHECQHERVQHLRVGHQRQVCPCFFQKAAQDLQDRMQAGGGRECVFRSAPASPRRLHRICRMGYKQEVKGRELLALLCAMSRSFKTPELCHPWLVSTVTDSTRKCLSRPSCNTNCLSLRPWPPIPPHPLP